MTAELDIRPYQPGDEEHIRELFRLSFGRELPEARWKWRYRDSPSGPAWIQLAWHGDTLVGHRAQTPVTLRFRRRDFCVGVAGGVMTHPLYRSQGIYAGITVVQLAWEAEAGVALSLGFPNSLSHRVMIDRNEFRDIYEIPVFRLSLPASSAPVEGGDHTASRQIVELAAFDERFDRLWERVRDDYTLITRRDRRHLQWRYTDNPTAQYRILACEEGGELLGYAVCKRYEQELQLVDLLTVPDVQVGIQLVKQASQIALDDGATALSLWLNVSHPLHRRLEKLGFRNGEPITYVLGKLLRPELPEELVFNWRNWYMTMGDSDVY
jgi:GNAT superfamily N-acetyltransferase